MDRNAEDGRVWFVTGGSSGFGRAVSDAVLERGDRLVVTARDAGSIEAITKAAPERAHAVELDVTDGDAVRSSVDETVDRFGRLDVVVNNAGYGYVGAIEEATDDELRQQFEVNLFGVINVTRAALPWMRRQRSGHLVQMSSLNGIEGLPGGGYYAASKFAVEGLSESLADEVAHLGIKVTLVEPGPHRTRFLNDDPAHQGEPMSDYADSVGQTREVLHEMDGNQPGDPARAARAIIEVVGSDEPPRRLPLGQMAVDNIRAKLTAQLDELDRWSELSASSDFPEDEQ